MSWTLALWLGLAGAIDCTEVLDRTAGCQSPVASQSMPEAVRVVHQTSSFEADALAPRMLAASGVSAFIALGAGLTAGFYQRHLSDLAATGNLSRAAENELRLYTWVSSIASVSAGIGATLLLAAAAVFTVFDPADGGLRDGIPALRE